MCAVPAPCDSAGLWQFFGFGRSDVAVGCWLTVAGCILLAVGSWPLAVDCLSVCFAASCWRFGRALLTGAFQAPCDSAMLCSLAVCCSDVAVGFWLLAAGCRLMAVS